MAEFPGFILKIPYLYIKILFINLIYWFKSIYFLTPFGAEFSGLNQKQFFIFIS